MTQSPSAVFLLDVDNTLLDNDRTTADLTRHHSSVRGLAPRALRYDLPALLAASIKAVSKTAQPGEKS
jgi:hypothetical protein